MALANKTSQKFYVTSGGGQDEINATRKAVIDSAFTADKNKGSAQLIDDQILGPLVFNIQRMQDDLDELRRFVVDATEVRTVISPLPDANVADDLTISGGTVNNSVIGGSTPAAITGTTIDASTNFTIGSSVITNNQIQFTPTAGDTATISATTHGELNITTVDAASDDANINIISDGYTKIDSAGAIVLDAGTGEEISFLSAGVNKGSFKPGLVPAGGEITTPITSVLDYTEVQMNTLATANSNKGLLAITGIPGLSIIVQSMTVVTTLDASVTQAVNTDAFLQYDGSPKNPNECIYYYRRWMYNAANSYANQEEWRMYRGIQVVAPRTPIGTSIYFTSVSNPTSGSINNCRLIISYILVKS